MTQIQDPGFPWEQYISTVFFPLCHACHCRGALQTCHFGCGHRQTQICSTMQVYLQNTCSLKSLSISRFFPILWTKFPGKGYSCQRPTWLATAAWVSSKSLVLALDPKVESHEKEEKKDMCFYYLSKEDYWISCWKVEISGFHHWTCSEGPRKDAWRCISVCN